MWGFPGYSHPDVQSCVQIFRELAVCGLPPQSPAKVQSIKAQSVLIPSAQSSSGREDRGDHPEYSSKTALPSQRKEQTQVLKLKRLSRQGSQQSVASEYKVADPRLSFAKLKFPTAHKDSNEWN